MNELPVISAVFDKGAKNYSTHQHNCHEMILVTKGHVRIILNRKEYIATQNDIVCFSNFENHSTEVLDSEYERYCIKLSPPETRGALKNNCLYSLFSNRPHDFSHLIHADDYADKLIFIFDRLVAEQQRDNDNFKYDVEKSLLRLLLTEIYRNSPDSFPQTSTPKNEIVELIKKDIETDCSSNYTLASFAEKYHISKSYLSHIFKETTGYGVLEYLFEYRLCIAKDMLCNESASASRIACELGFSSSGNFSRYFKNKTGMTPIEYHKQHMRKEAEII